MPNERAKTDQKLWTKGLRRSAPHTSYTLRPPVCRKAARDDTRLVGFENNNVFRIDLLFSSNYNNNKKKKNQENCINNFN